MVGIFPTAIIPEATSEPTESETPTKNNEVIAPGQGTQTDNSFGSALAPVLGKAATPQAGAPVTAGTETTGVALKEATPAAQAPAPTQSAKAAVTSISQTTPTQLATDTAAENAYLRELDATNKQIQADKGQYGVGAAAAVAKANATAPTATASSAPIVQNTPIIVKAGGVEYNPTGEPTTIAPVTVNAVVAYSSSTGAPIGFVSSDGQITQTTTSDGYTLTLTDIPPSTLQQDLSGFGTVTAGGPSIEVSKIGTKAPPTPLLTPQEAIQEARTAAQQQKQTVSQPNASVFNPLSLKQTVSQPNASVFNPLSLNYYSQILNSVGQDISKGFSNIGKTYNTATQQAAQNQATLNLAYLTGQINQPTFRVFSVLNALTPGGEAASKAIEETPVLGNVVNFIRGEPQIVSALNSNTVQGSLPLLTAVPQAVGAGYLLGRGMGVGAPADATLEQIALNAAGRLGIGAAAGSGLYAGLGALSGQTAPSQVASNILGGASSGATYSGLLSSLSTLPLFGDVGKYITSLDNPYYRAILNSLQNAGYGLGLTNVASLASGLGPATLRSDILSAGVGAALPLGGDVLEKVNDNFGFKLPEFNPNEGVNTKALSLRLGNTDIPLINQITENGATRYGLGTPAFEDISNIAADSTRNNMNRITTNYADQVVRNTLKTAVDTGQINPDLAAHYIDTLNTVKQSLALAKTLPPPSELNINMDKNLYTPEEIANIKTALQEIGGQFKVYGTASANIDLADVYKQAGDVLFRGSHDIDAQQIPLRSSDPAAAAQKVADIMGDGYSVNQDGNNYVVQRDLDGQKVFDLKASGQIPASGEETIPQTEFGLKHSNPITVEGVKLAPVQDTILDKAFSSLTLRINPDTGELTIQPAAARSTVSKSDLADLYAVLRAVVQWAGGDTSIIDALAQRAVQLGLMPQGAYEVALNNPNVLTSAQAVAQSVPTPTIPLPVVPFIAPNNPSPATEPLGLSYTAPSVATAPTEASLFQSLSAPTQSPSSASSAASLPYSIGGSSPSIPYSTRLRYASPYVGVPISSPSAFGYNESPPVSPSLSLSPSFSPSVSVPPSVSPSSQKSRQEGSPSTGLSFSLGKGSRPKLLTPTMQKYGRDYDPSLISGFLEPGENARFLKAYNPAENPAADISGLAVRPVLSKQQTERLREMI